MASQTYSLLALGERQDQVWVAEDRFPCWREPLAPVEAEVSVAWNWRLETNCFPLLNSA
jgi:hypothetical protein